MAAANKFRGTIRPCGSRAGPAERPVDIDKRFAVTHRFGRHGTPADPGRIEAAEQSRKVEDERADGLRTHDGDQRKRKPDEITEQMAADEKRTRLASLPRADAEQRQPWNEHIEQCRQKGADNKRLGRDGDSCH